MYTLSTVRRTSLLLVLLLLAFPSLTHAQVVDNAGTDFYMGFMTNDLGAASVEVHLTADVATNVTVHYPVNSPSFTTTVPVTPGDITIVTLPVSAANGWTPGTAQNNAVRAFGPDEFVAYMINRAPFTSDAGLALPVDALNTDYRVLSYFSNIVSQDRSEFAVIAAFDNTTVTITPTAGLAGGFAANTPFNVTLNRGEGFLGRGLANGTANDLTGTLIEASRPVSVTNGNRCTNVPPNTTACDHIFEVAQPLASWGNEVLTAPLPNRPNGSRYRVIAAEDNTTVQLNGGAFATLNAGEFAETATVTGPQIFSGDKPIFVAQYMTGVTGSGSAVGDPAMGNMIPSEQYLAAYTFSTPGNNQFVDHFVSVIAQNDDVNNGTIFLDGAVIPAGQFTSIPGTSFSFATIEIDEGTHTTSSAGTHGITVEGYNSADSYIFPGGARFQIIFQGEDDTPPVCSGSVDIDTFFGTATDLLSDDPDNQGIFFVALSDDSENLTLNVDPFTPGDEMVTYQVTRTDPSMDGSGSVVVTDGAGNTCSSAVFIPADGGGGEDTEAPACGPIDLVFNGGTYEIVSSASDNVGITSVAVTLLTSNLEAFIDGNGPFAQGDVVTFDPAEADVDLLARLTTFSGRFAFLVTVSDAAGNSSVCDPVITDLEGALPEVTALLQAYPNPARVGQGGLVTVPFRLAEASDVRLVIYDVLGREVAVLADGEMSAGSYEVAWPEAAALPAGSYVVRMTAGTVVQTQRLTLVR